MDWEMGSVDSIHWETAHSRRGIRPHYLDFDHYPRPVKSYGQGEAIILGPVKGGGEDRAGRGTLLPYLSELLFTSYGVTALGRSGAGRVPLRPVPSAGGLYPCHLYLGILPRDRRETGLYYYDPLNHRLVLLRRTKGVTTPDLSGADLSGSRLFFCITAWLYNSAWKYRDRALRYVMLDAGHLAENLLLAGTGNPRVASGGFDDGTVGKTLGLDLNRETPLILVSMNWNKSVSELERIFCQETMPVFPETLAGPWESAYMETLVLPEKILSTGKAVPGKTGEGKESSGVWGGTPPGTVAFSWEADPENTGTAIASDLNILGSLIARRRSRRNFIARTITPGEQKKILDWVLSGAQAWQDRMTLALACQHWEGVEDGLYAVDPGSNTVKQITAGNIHSRLAAACLGQTWVGMAGTVFLCLANLEALERDFGMRGYRHGMLAAGRVGQRIYLGAESAGMGCCGIGAFYDREAADILGLNRVSALLYALAAGPVKKKLGTKIG